MKKYFLFFLIIFIMAGAFLAGSLYTQRWGNRNTVNDVRHFQKENSGGQEEEDLSSMPMGTVKISPEKQQMIGVRIEQVEKKTRTHIIRLLGRVAPDENRVFRLNASTELWVRKVYSPTTGSVVRKGDPLLDFYATNFYSAAAAFLYALDTRDRVKASQTPHPSQQVPLQYQIRQAVESLQNLGVSEAQIAEMERTRKASDLVVLRSPTGGLILSRTATLGQWIVPGNEMFQIADLSRVWILADVYEREAQHFKPGAKAMVILPYQDRTYQATVSEVLPVFDARTRTLKVRLEVDNPGFVMRPDMFVDVEYPIKLPPAIAIPSDAILDSGMSKTVFVARGNGFFEPREVETGWRAGNRVEITKGLEVGEKIVTSGTFLIDSESKLELAAQGMYTTLSKDPVCGVDVAIRKADKAGLKASYKGKIYYFDSEECKRKFEKEPERYVVKEK